MKIAIGSDHGAFALKSKFIAHLEAQGHEVKDFGTYTTASCEAAYSATKGAVIALTKALAKELGPSGIRVNCVAPGVILTDMCASVEPEILGEMAEETPVGRNGTPMDVAKAMEYLADAEFITGHILSVNGGYII